MSTDRKTLATLNGQVEFDTPANRIIAAQQPKERFRIDTSLPDIAFLRQLSIQGRLRFFTGTKASTGDIITVTPNNGETFFVYKIFLNHVSSGLATFLITNGTNTRASITVVAGDGGLEFNMFDSLVGNSIETINIHATVTAGTAQANILGWSENTSRIRDPTI